MKESLYSLADISLSINNLNKKMEKDFGISLVQWCVLSRLVDMPAASAFSLAEAVGVHPSTLSEILPRLEKKGFLFMSEDPNDSRRKMISITRLGRDKLENTHRMAETGLAGIDKIEKELYRVRASLKVYAGREDRNLAETNP